jgi:hypothetical protein
MEAEAVMTVTELSNHLTVLFLPVIAVVMTVLFGMAIKDAGAAIAKGMMFRFNATFKEGDIVFLDGERAIIVKVGILQSVFGITKPDGTYCWRYVSNTKMDNLRLEKILNLSLMKLPSRDGNPADDSMSNVTAEEPKEK